MRFILLLLLAQLSWATDYISCASGNSNSASTWALTSAPTTCGAGVPGSSDTATVTAAVTLNANFSVSGLTVTGSGKLTGTGYSVTSTGDIIYSPASYSNTCAITLGAGSRLIMGTRLHGSGAFAYSPLCLTGTPDSPITVSGGYLTCDAYGCGITGTYIQWTNVGDATHPLTQVWTAAGAPTGNDLNLTHSTFTNCGAIMTAGTGSIPDGASWVEQYNVHNDTLSNTIASPLLPSSFTSETRSIIFNVYDKAYGTDSLGNRGSVWGATITDNYFGGGFSSEGTAASWTRNFVRSSTEDNSTPSALGFNGVVGCSSFQYSYLMIDDVAPGHLWNPTVLGDCTTTALAISNNVFDSTASNNILVGAGNDGLVDDSTTANHTINYSYNLSLMGSDGYGVASNVDIVSSLTTILNANHNTGVATPYGAYEYELEGSGNSDRGSLTNNIVVDPTNASRPVNFFFLQSHCSTLNPAVTTDVFAPTALNHNGIYGLATGGGAGSGSSCDSSIFLNQANSAAGAWSATPNAVGLVIGNPEFVDPTRSVALWDHNYWGTTYSTWTPGTAYTQGTCVSLAQAGYYSGDSINYCARQNLSGSEANSTPGTGSASRLYWEWAGLPRIRTAIQNGSTITDSSLGLSGATYIQALNAWVEKGFSPTNVAYHNTASDGTDIGAVVYSGGPPVPVVSGIVGDDVAYGGLTSPNSGGHSSVRFAWNSDLTPDSQQVRFGPTNTYGSVLTVYQANGSASNQQMVVSGNTPGSQVHFCPQSHNTSPMRPCGLRCEGGSVVYHLGTP
jgi:hypothetical protein